MPKYYRFRPNSPTRLKDKEDMHKYVKTITMSISDKNTVTAVLTPTQLWYHRRTWWREPAMVMITLSRKRTPATRWVKASKRYAHASHALAAFDKSSTCAQVWRFPCQLI